MMNYFRILLAILCFAYLSCSSNKDDDPSRFLEIDLGKSSSILIPAPANTLSCDQIAKGDTATGAITGSYFTLPNPNIKWTETVAPDLSEVRIVVLKFTLKSPKIGGEYTCVFSDLSLGSLFFKRNSVGQNVVVSTWDGKLGKNSSSLKNSTGELISGQLFDPCDIKCGGVNVPKGTQQFSVTGEWELLAVQKKFISATSTEYEEFPIRVTGSFTVDNTLN